jgi:hypothetical protein
MEPYRTRAGRLRQAAIRASGLYDPWGLWFVPAFGSARFERIMSAGFILAIVIILVVGLWGMRKAGGGRPAAPGGSRPQVVRKEERPLTLDERIAEVAKERDPAAARAARRRLAEQCIRAGRAAEAVKLYEAALAGARGGDPALTFGLAHAHFENRDYGQCAATLDRVRQPDGRFKVPEMQLLYARSLEAASRFDEAKAAYAAAVEICPGEEARCRQALLLRRAGDPEAAIELFQAIVRSVAKADPAYLRTQREWFEIAKREIGG